MSDEKINAFMRDLRAHGISVYACINLSEYRVGRVTRLATLRSPIGRSNPVSRTVVGQLDVEAALQAAEKRFQAVIPSEARNLALSIFKVMRDSSSPAAPRNDRPEGFFRSLFIRQLTDCHLLLWPSEGANPTQIMQRLEEHTAKFIAPALVHAAFLLLTRG